MTFISFFCFVFFLLSCRGSLYINEISPLLSCKYLPSLSLFLLSFFVNIFFHIIVLINTLLGGGLGHSYKGLLQSKFYLKIFPCFLQMLSFGLIIWPMSSFGCKSCDVRLRPHSHFLQLHTRIVTHSFP